MVNVNHIFLFRFLPSNKRILNFLLTGKEKTHKIYNEIIEKVKQQKFQANDDGSFQIDTILKCFLNEKCKRQFENDSKLQFCNNKQFRHLLADIFGASVDTTLTTIRWFLLYTSQSTEIQQKIREVCVIW